VRLLVIITNRTQEASTQQVLPFKYLSKEKFIDDFNEKIKEGKDYITFWSKDGCDTNYMRSDFFHCGKYYPPIVMTVDEFFDGDEECGQCNVSMCDKVEYDTADWWKQEEKVLEEPHGVVELSPSKVPIELESFEFRVGDKVSHQEAPSGIGIIKQLIWSEQVDEDMDVGHPWYQIEWLEMPGMKSYIGHEAECSLEKVPTSDELNKKFKQGM
jgi:hypothetical protein